MIQLKLKESQNRLEYIHRFDLVDPPTPGDWAIFTALKLADVYTTYRGLKYNCVKEINLEIEGLMVIPPNDGNHKKYFERLSQLNRSLALKELSMGMSADYIDAVKLGATFVRIGSSIFGSRS